MAVLTACPAVSLLEQLALGRMPPHEVEQLARHCEGCPRCVQLLLSLKAEDTLTEAMAAQRTAIDQSRDPIARALMERLERLQSPASASMDRTNPLSSAATPSGVESTRAYDLALAPAQAPGEIGRLGGHRVLEVLGVGGMGVVYRAEDTHLQRQVALKVMKPELARDAHYRERFLREARAAAKLKSDHVVTIHQVGQEGSVVFLAMELLEGLSLDEWLKKGRKPTLAQAARMGRQIALGLADAHACGLIHRDIKPGNIWLDSRHQGRVKLLDFGLARGDSEDVHLTQSGVIVGTPAYMAPEQARGEKVDHRADLFSLGIVLYRLTTGQLPFRGDNTASLLAALIVDTPRPPREINPDIPPRLASLIERLLAKDRSQRPQTARAVADELAAIERETAIPAATDVRPVPAAGRDLPPPAAIPTRPLPPGAWRWLVAAALLVMLGGVAGIVVIIRDKHGKEVARVPVPPGGSATMQEEDNKPAPPTEPVRIEPESLAEMAPGAPLSTLALVRRPARLPGVRSWSIVSREMGVPATVTYRPNGEHLAVTSWDGSVHIWEAKSGRLVRVLLPPDGGVSMAWSPDGKVLAIGTGATTRCVTLWDIDAGRLLRTLVTPKPDFIFTVAWSPDGRTLRAWGTSRRCHTWEVARGKLLHSTPILESQYQWSVLSPEGLRLAGVQEDNRIVIWDAGTGKEVSRLTAPAAVWDLSWSPDGKRLASTGRDGLRVWDMETHKEVLHYAKGLIQNNPPAWSPDGRTLALNLDTTEIVLIDAASAQKQRRLEDGGGSWLAWSPDGKTIARINGEPWVRTYDTASGERRMTLVDGRPLRGVAWSPKQPVLAVTDRYDTLLLSADTGQVQAELKQATRLVAWSPNGKRLAAQGPENTVQLWRSDGQLDGALADYKAEITSLAWSPDGKRLATTAVGEKRVLIWDTAKGERQRVLGPFDGVAESVKWSADGKLVTFNVVEVGWHIWDVEKGQLVNEPAKWKVFWLELTPDGRSALIAPTRKAEYRLRDLAGGKDGLQLPYGYSLYLAHPTWSPDGQVLATTSWGAIDLWPADLGKPLHTFPFAGGANRIGFSPDGKRLVALQGYHLFVWETDTGRLRGVLVVGKHNNALTITADGHYTGTANVESGIVMLVEKDDGTQEMLEPAEFKKKYGFKNDPGSVRLIDK